MKNTRETLSGSSSLAGIGQVSLMIALAAGFPVAGYANPEDGVIKAGSVTIQESGKKLDIYQSSDKAVIDWRKFNIEADEHTQFHQPGKNSIALNRVKDNNPSRIMGKLTANGNVIIINPNGVMFGKGAKVDVNGIVATSADIDTDKFMSGDMKFNKPGNPDAAISNEGEITAKEAGLVGLVAPNVNNSGVIKAKLGKVQISSADEFTLDMYGDGLVEMKVSDDVKSQIVKNSGTIEANGGVIELTATAGKRVVTSLVDVGGTLKATSVSQRNGKIIIGGSTNKGGTTKVSGKLDVSGKGTGENGGKISLTADQVALEKTAELDASGNTGGGAVHVGGEYQGKGTLANARATFIAKGAKIKADATENGKGGEVIVWADDTTRFYGNISAKGALLGNGGFAEVSGKKYLDFNGNVDLSGKTVGTLLLDPDAIEIVSGSGNPTEIDDDTVDFSENSGGTSVIGADVISSRLSANANVILQANNSILVNSQITSTGDGNLTLETGTNGSITINNSIVMNTGDLNLVSDFIEINAALSGSGNLIFKNTTLNRSIGIGSGTGDYNLDGTEIGKITNGWNSIVIGQNTNTGHVNIGASVFHDSLEVHGGTVNIVGNYYNDDPESKIYAYTGNLNFNSALNNTYTSSDTSGQGALQQFYAFGDINVNSPISLAYGNTFPQLLLSATLGTDGNVNVSDTITVHNGINIIAKKDVVLNGELRTNNVTSSYGAISVKAADGDVNGTGKIYANSVFKLANGGLELVTGSNGGRPDIILNSTNYSINGTGGGSAYLKLSGFNDITLDRGLKILNSESSISATNKLYINQEITRANGNKLTLTGTNGIYLNANILTTTNGQSITFNGDVVLGSDVTISAGNLGTSSITFNNKVNGDGVSTRALVLNAGAALSLMGKVGDVNKLGDITLNSSQLAISDAIYGSGVLRLTEYGDDGAMEIGGNSAGHAWRLDGTEAGHIKNGFSSVTIGSTTHAANIDVTGAVGFSNSTTIRNDAKQISLSGNITTTNGSNLTLRAHTVNSSNNSLDIGGSFTAVATNIVMSSLTGFKTGQDATFSGQYVVFSPISGVSVSGNTSITSSVGYAKVALNGTIGGNLAVSTPANLELGGDFTVNGDASFTSNRIAISTGAGHKINGNANGSSTLTFREYGNDAAMEIGGTSAGSTWQIDATEFGVIKNGFNSIVFGDSSHTGNINLTGAISPTGSITFNSSTGTIYLGSGAINAASGKSVTFNGNVTLNGAASVTGSGGVTFSKKIEGDGVSTRNLIVDAGTTGNVTFTGSVGSSAKLGNITVDGLTITASSTIGLTGNIDFEAADDISINGAISRVSDSNGTAYFKAKDAIKFLAGNLTASGAGKYAITLNSNSDETNGGYISLTNSKLTSNGGDIILGGGSDPLTKYAEGNSGQAHGIYLNAGNLVSGSGTITVHGKADSATGSSNGIYLYANSGIESTSGKISLYGDGGNGTVGNMSGFSLSGVAGINYVKSTSGIIEITGTTDSISSSTSNEGVWIAGTSYVESGGNINITAKSGGSQSAALYLSSPSGIKATGTGTITVNATSSTNAPSGTENYGVYLSNGGGISSDSGKIDITGIGGTGNGGKNYDLYFDTSGTNKISSTSGNININTDVIEVSSTGASISTGSSGIITIAQRTDGRVITVNDTSGGLFLTSDLMNSISTANLVIGNSKSGAITSKLGSWSTNLSYLSDGAITIANALTTGGNFAATTDDTLNINAALVVGAGKNASLTSNLFAMGTSGSLASVGGYLYLKPYSGAREIRVNYNPNGSTYNISTANIEKIQNGWSKITIGSTAQTATTSISTSTWYDPILFERSTSTGSTYIYGNLTGLDDASISFSGGTTRIGAVTINSTSDISISSSPFTRLVSGVTSLVSGGKITLIGPIYTGDGATLNVSAAGDIIFGDVIRTSNPDGSKTALVNFSGKTLSLTGDWGETTNYLGAVTLTAIESITLPKIYADDLTVSVTGAGNKITTGGTLSVIDDMTLAADDLVIGHALSGAGTLTLRPYETDTVINVGTGAPAGGFNMTAAEVSKIASGWTSVAIGNSNSDENVNIGTSAWASNVTFLNDADMNIIENAVITTTNGASLTFNSDDLYFNTGSSVNSSGSVTVNADTNWNSTGKIEATSNITFTDSLRLSDAVTMVAGNTITLDKVNNSGAAKNMTLTAATLVLGGKLGDEGNALGDVALKSTNSITLPEIHATDLTTTVSGGGNKITTGGTITVNDDLEFVAEDVEINHALAGSGDLILHPYLSSTQVKIGGTGDFNLSTAEIAKLTNGWDNIIIGRSDSAGKMTLAAASFTDNVIFRNNGNITTSGVTTTDGATVTFEGGANTYVDIIGNINSANSITVNAGKYIYIHNSNSVNLTATKGDISLNAFTSVDSPLVMNASAGTITIANMEGNNSRVQANNLTATANKFVFGDWSQTSPHANGGKLGDVNLTSAQSITLPYLSATGQITVRTTDTGSDITLGGNMATTATGDSVIFAAADDFINSNNKTITTGGRWLIYSDNTTDIVKGGLSSDFNRYSCTYGATCPSFAAETGNGFLYKFTPILDVIIADKSKTYGEASNPAFTYSIDAADYISGDSGIGDIAGSIVLGTTASQYSNVGDYAITKTGTLTSNMGYGFNYIDGNLEVTKRDAYVTTTSGTKIYGEADPTFSGTNNMMAYDLNLIGIVYTPVNYNGDVGTYNVEVAATTNLERLDNYNITFNSGTMTVNKRDAVVTIADKVKTYGDANPNYSLTHNLIGSDASQLGWAYDIANYSGNAGTYSIGAHATGNVSRLDNYNVIYNTGNLTVNKADLSITANNATRPYSQANPIFTASYSGFKNGDTASVFANPLMFETLATSGSAAGVYAINPYNATASNYNITFNSGNLTVAGMPIPNNISVSLQNPTNLTHSQTAIFEDAQANNIINQSNANSFEFFSFIKDLMYKKRNGDDEEYSAL